MLDYLSSENKKKPCIIFIHGIGGTANSFKNQIKKLKNKYYVIALNLPGYGKSSFEKNTSITSYAKNIYNFILENNLSLPVLVGHSLGGMIVQKIAITYPNIAKACILLGTTSKFGSSNPKWQKDFINSRIKPLINGESMKKISLSSVKNIVACNTSENKIKFASKIMGNIDSKTYIVAINSLLNFDLSNKLHKISIPTLLIAGDQDTLSPPKTMNKMHKEIKNSKFIIIKDCGHLINIEHSTKLNNIIDKFINEMNLLNN